MIKEKDVYVSEWSERGKQERETWRNDNFAEVITQYAATVKLTRQEIRPSKHSSLFFVTLCILILLQCSIQKFPIQMLMNLPSVICKPLSFFTISSPHESALFSTNPFSMVINLQNYILFFPTCLIFFFII